MPYCEVCHHKLDKDRVCQNCRAEEAYHEAEAEKEWQRFLAYTDDTFLTDSLLADGSTEQEAIEQVQDLSMMSIALELAGPAKLLKDRWAREALLNAVINRDERIMLALHRYFESQKPKRKRGPKPDRRTGKYKTDKVIELKNAGKTEGQIAKLLYGEPGRAKRVSALIARARKAGKLAVAAETPTQPRPTPQ